jgi:hypothetical protein
MRDAIIVFIGIGVLILLPLVFWGIRSLLESRKEKDSRYLLLRLSGTILVCALVIILLVYIYNFTLGYQLPLVAERYLQKEGYALLKGQGWEMDGVSVYFSENIYDNEDGTKTIYIQFQGVEESNYISLDMKMVGNRWEVDSPPNIILGDNEDYPEINKRFYPVGVKLTK